MGLGGGGAGAGLGLAGLGCVEVSGAFWVRLGWGAWRRSSVVWSIVWLTPAGGAALRVSRRYVRPGRRGRPRGPAQTLGQARRWGARCGPEGLDCRLPGGPSGAGKGASWWGARTGIERGSPGRFLVALVAPAKGPGLPTGVSGCGGRRRPDLLPQRLVGGEGVRLGVRPGVRGGVRGGGRDAVGPGRGGAGCWSYDRLEALRGWGSGGLLPGVACRVGWWFERASVGGEVVLALVELLAGDAGGPGDV